MKKIVLPVLAALLALSGATLAQQSGDQKKASAMKDMMPAMTKQNQSGEGGMEGRNGMMGMMKMEQCNDMMNSVHHRAEKATETQKK